MLVLHHVAKHFAMRPVLRDISLDLRPGEITLLMGSNGAGKTTLLRLMAGLLLPSSGTLERHCQAGEVGYLGHATFVYPGLSALENLHFWDQLMNPNDPTRRDALKHPCRPDAHLEAMLQRVELQRFAHEPAGTFSRGMAQRLNLARVLLQNPVLLLLDEPGTGLDQASQKLLHTEIAAAKARNACVVWISHDWKTDRAHADRVVALQHGLVNFDGKAGEAPW